MKTTIILKVTFANGEVKFLVTNEEVVGNFLLTDFMGTAEAAQVEIVSQIKK